MAQRLTAPGYRIGPMPRLARVDDDRSALWAVVLGAIVLAWLVGFVVVLNEGVERGQHIRASLSASPSGVSTALVRADANAGRSTDLLAAASRR